MLSLFFKDLFIFILAMLGLHCCARAFSSCSEWGLLSSCEASQRGSWALRHVGFSSCGTQASLLLCGRRRSCIWDLPGAGTEPMSSALAGRFSTTGPPEKPSYLLYTQYQ